MTGCLGKFDPGWAAFAFRWIDTGGQHERLEQRLSWRRGSVARRSPPSTSSPLSSYKYKEIPSIDGTKCDDAYFVTSTSRFSNLSFKAGSGELDFPDAGDDPVARLQPVKISSALYGTMDDLYPENICVLRDLMEKL